MFSYGASGRSGRTAALRPRRFAQSFALLLSTDRLFDCVVRFSAQMARFARPDLDFSRPDLVFRAIFDRFFNCFLDRGFRCVFDAFSIVFSDDFQTFSRSFAERFSIVVALWRASSVVRFVPLQAVFSRCRASVAARALLQKTQRKVIENPSKIHRRTSTKRSAKSIAFSSKNR